MDSIDTIVDQVIEDLDLIDRVNTANLQSIEIEILEKVLEHYIAERLKDIDCYVINDHNSDEAPEAIEIVKRVWERLGETHKLRIVG